MTGIFALSRRSVKKYHQKNFNTNGTVLLRTVPTQHVTANMAAKNKHGRLQLLYSSGGLFLVNDISFGRLGGRCWLRLV